MKDHYGMTFDGRAHDAQYDAENTMRLFFKMQDAYFA
jgi:inhibitor of KinA sporulation pathway (predicted exonuclease)